MKNVTGWNIKLLNQIQFEVSLLLWTLKVILSSQSYWTVTQDSVCGFFPLKLLFSLCCRERKICQWSQKMAVILTTFQAETVLSLKTKLNLAAALQMSPVTAFIQPPQMKVLISRWKKRLKLKFLRPALAYQNRFMQRIWGAHLELQCWYVQIPKKNEFMIGRITVFFAPSQY